MLYVSSSAAIRKEPLNTEMLPKKNIVLQRQCGGTSVVGEHPLFQQHKREFRYTSLRRGGTGTKYWMALDDFTQVYGGCTALVRCTNTLMFSLG